MTSCAKIKLTIQQKEAAALAIADILTTAQKVANFTELPTVETILSNPNTVGSDPTEIGYLHEEGNNRLYVGFCNDNDGNLVVLAQVGEATKPSIMNQYTPLVV